MTMCDVVTHGVTICDIVTNGVANYITYGHAVTICHLCLVIVKLGYGKLG